MFYVYILLCGDSGMYIGYTHNLKARFLRHRQGLVTATKGRLPVSVLFYEAYTDKYDALRREKYFKTTKGKQTLRSMLREALSKMNADLER